jgi:cyclopropane-fatty-acyl-phospholipid synthase
MPTQAQRSTAASAAEAELQALLSPADIQFNGDRPWDPQVHNDRLYRRVWAGGSLAAGEAYVEGWWDCASLDELFYRLLRARIDRQLTRSWRALWMAFKARLLNRQSKARAREVGKQHYDRDIDLFERMLDPRLVYSCGYWRRASTLAEAQEAKLDLICRKLRLRPGQRVLDIGCGWGSFAEYAARQYGVEVVGITISAEQAAYARRRCADLPVEIRLQDYRAVEETFDRVVSIGMFEHVGHKNHRTYMETVQRCLEGPDALTLLHTIGCSESSVAADPWIDQYIFPNGLIPSQEQVMDALDGVFIIEDWHNFGPDYDRTLMAWAENFEDAWPEIAGRYDEHFFRLWRYYLYQSAGAFRARRNQLWQIVLSPEDTTRQYRSVR